MNIETLKPSAAVRAHMDTIAAAVDACEETNAALDRINAEGASKKLVLDAATADRATALTARAKQSEPAKVRAFEPQLKKLSTAVSEAALEIESIDIARAALEAELAEREAQVDQLKREGLAGIALAQYAQHITSDLDERIQASIAQHVMPLVLAAAALVEATNAADLARWLNDLNVPKFGMPGTPIASGLMSELQGRQIKPRTAWRDTPELVEVNRAAGEVRQAIARLDRYVTRKGRLAAAAPTEVYYRRSWSTTGGAADRAEDEARHAQKLAAASAGAPQQASDVRGARSSAAWETGQPPARGAQQRRAPIDGNMGARVLDDPELAQFR
jgi:hypothetical protein